MNLTKKTMVLTLFWTQSCWPAPALGQGPTQFPCGLPRTEPSVTRGSGFLVALSVLWRQFLPEQLLWLNREGCVPAKYTLWENKLIEPALWEGLICKVTGTIATDTGGLSSQKLHQSPSRGSPCHLSCFGNGCRLRGAMWCRGCPGVGR